MHPPVPHFLDIATQKDIARTDIMIETESPHHMLDVIVWIGLTDKSFLLEISQCWHCVIYIQLPMHHYVTCTML